MIAITTRGSKNNGFMLTTSPIAKQETIPITETKIEKLLFFPDPLQISEYFSLKN
jgi:hypothetical protein